MDFQTFWSPLQRPYQCRNRKKLISKHWLRGKIWRDLRLMRFTKTVLREWSKLLRAREIPRDLGSNGFRKNTTVQRRAVPSLIAPQTPILLAATTMPTPPRMTSKKNTRSSGISLTNNAELLSSNNRFNPTLLDLTATHLDSLNLKWWFQWREEQKGMRKRAAKSNCRKCLWWMMRT